MMTHNQKTWNTAYAQNQFTHNDVYWVSQKRILTLIHYTIHRMMLYNENQIHKMNRVMQLSAMSDILKQLLNEYYISK